MSRKTLTPAGAALLCAGIATILFSPCVEASSRTDAVNSELNSIQEHYKEIPSPKEYDYTALPDNPQSYQPVAETVETPVVAKSIPLPEYQEVKAAPLEEYKEVPGGKVENEDQSKPDYSLPHAVSRVHELDVGTDVYYYHYNEPDLGVWLTGVMNGYYANYQYRPLEDSVLNNSVLNMYAIEAHYAEADLDYKGSGHDDGRKNDMYELRALLGKDLFQEGARVTPYFGFGYRRLVDQGGSRLSSDGHIGYDRESHYFYLPIGATVQFPERNGLSISANAEYDHFIQGVQKSKLGDADQFGATKYGDLRNDQKKGFGVRGSVKFLKNGPKIDLFAEPFIRFWNIEDSEVEVAPATSGAFYGLEPHNLTTEVGSKFGLNF